MPAHIREFADPGVTWCMKAGYRVRRSPIASLSPRRDRVTSPEGSSRITGLVFCTHSVPLPIASGFIRCPQNSTRQTFRTDTSRIPALTADQVVGGSSPSGSATGALRCRGFILRPVHGPSEPVRFQPRPRGTRTGSQRDCDEPLADCRITARLKASQAHRFTVPTPRNPGKTIKGTLEPFAEKLAMERLWEPSERDRHHLGALIGGVSRRQFPRWSTSRP